MGSKYSTTAIAGFNAAPPPDDASVSASNQLQWAKHINKIGTPLKDLAESINTKLVTFTDFGSRSVTVSDSTAATDHMKTVEIASTATSGVTISLADAVTMTAGYIVTVKNLSAYSQTIGRVTVGDFINGAAQNLAIPPKGHYTFKVAATATNGYYTLDAAIHGHGSDIASAASINLDTATGNLVDVTGTTTITSVVLSDGRICVARFTGILTLTNSANLILPGAANITTAAGDYGIFAGYASSIVRCLSFVRASAAPVSGSNTGDQSIVTLGTEQASTSGTSIDFTGIPTGTKRITVMFVGVSISGTSDPIIQIGDSGGVEAAGYISACEGTGLGITTSTTGFAVSRSTDAAADSWDGQITLNLEDSSGFTWTSSGMLFKTSAVTNRMNWSTGSKSLSAELDRVRITTSGGVNTFDAGAININYER